MCSLESSHPLLKNELYTPLHRFWELWHHCDVIIVTLQKICLYFPTYACVMPRYRSKPLKFVVYPNFTSVIQCTVSYQEDTETSLLTLNFTFGNDTHCKSHLSWKPLQASNLIFEKKFHGNSSMAWDSWDLNVFSYNIENWLNAPYK